MSFSICRGTLGSLAMFTAIRNASSRVRQQFGSSRGVSLIFEMDIRKRPARVGIARKAAVVRGFKLALYFRSKKIVLHSAELTLCAVCEAVMGTGVTAPALGLMFVVFPSDDVN